MSTANAQILKSAGIKSADYNARFPNANQSKNCWANFVEHHRCVAYATEHGYNTQRCARYKIAYRDLCPDPWTERWFTWIEEGRFPGQESWKTTPGEAHKSH